jgi:serine/threonine-protein kinase/endoribonuclease IRE1
VLSQPRLRLQDILPSAIHQRDYSDDQTAFVGLVPGTDSLFALSPDHFPLVAFSESAPTQRIEGSEGVVVSGEHGTLQCFEGTTDRRCLTGVRALRADSLSRLARLLDGVPGPASSLLPSTTSDPAHSENTNSQVYTESEPLIVPGEAEPPVVPWEWLAGLPESLSQGRNSWAHSSSGLLLALVSVMASLLWFNRKGSPNGHDATVRMSAGSVSRKLDRNTPADGNAGLIAPLERTEDATDTAPSELQAAEVSPSAENPAFARNPTVTPETPKTPNTAWGTAPNTPVPPSTDVDIKDSPVKPESQEGMEDVGEVKKKRKRRRRRKGDTKDTAAEGGEEPENEDGEGGEDGTVVPPGTPSSGVPSTQVPPASSSLVVSDTVLGMFLSVTSNKLFLIKTRLRFAWHCRLRGLLARPCRGSQTSPSRFCYPRTPRSQPS